MKEDRSIIPDYNESEETAAEYLRMVVPLFSKCRIPANPINYSLCYEYVSGKNQPLQDIFTNQIKSQQLFSPDVTRNLYKQYVLNGSPDKYDVIGAGLKSLVHQTLDTLETTETKASSTATNFANITKELSSAQDLVAVREIVEDIITETEMLVDTSNALKTLLKETNEEVRLLRTELNNIKKSADRDALTGLLNRSAFDRKINKLVEQTTQSTQTAYLLLVDIDDFKRIGEKFGHLVGDKVLRYTAKLLQQFIKSNEAAARYGSEEMALLILNVNQSEAIERANEMRETMEKSRLKRKDNGDWIGQITISIGVSGLRALDSIDSLFDRADCALTAAKEKGQNQVVCDHELSHSWHQDTADSML